VIQWQMKKLKQRNVELEVLLKLADSLTLELETANRTLQEQSLTDPLTGLKNRRYLYATIAKDIAQVKRMYRAQEAPPGSAPIQNNDLLFFMVDVDHFKWVNDTFGHGAGDAVLQQVADLLRKATRGSDTVIRWGGEEFLVVARQANRDEAAVVAERIRRFVEKHRFDLPDGHSIHRTCSVGFTAYPLDGVESLHIEWDRVVDLADRCLYRAKEGGRNQWVGLMPSTPAGPSRFTMDITGEMEELLDQGLMQVIGSGPGKTASETINPPVGSRPSTE
jgi:diguanylate cyclase (GGDEF)-like protein